MNILFDLKYAWRLLFKSPGHTLLCALVVALSVGLAIFSFVLAYSQAFKPLPFPGSDVWSSIQLCASATGRPQPVIDAYTYQELKKHRSDVDHLGGFSARTAVLSEGEQSVSLSSAAISPSLLAEMKPALLFGRLFEPADALPGAAPVVILDFDTWKNYFAGDPELVGKHARIDGELKRIAGVLPADFLAFEDFAIWTPLQLPALAKPSDSTAMITAFIRLEEGQNAEVLQRELKPAIDEVNRLHPGLFNAERSLLLVPAHRTFSQNNLEVVALVSFIAASVLLLAALNISLVFFARLLERGRELALRTALGSSRRRLLRQCLLETALIVLVGLGFGYLFGALAIEWTHSIADFAGRITAKGSTENIPALSFGDIVVALGSALLLWLLSTLIPAWRVTRQDAAVVLSGSGKGLAGGGGNKTANLLVGVQVAVTCMVLVICMNLVASVNEEASRPSGLNTEAVVLSTYPTVFDPRRSDGAERLRYWDDLTREIKSRLPGALVAYTTAVPTRAPAVPAAIETREGSAGRETIKLPVAAVSEEYFATLGLSLVAGRLFEAADDARSLGVAVVDEATARHHWPSIDPLGKRIQLDPVENGPWLTIVGVVSFVRRPYPRDVGVIYRPLRQVIPEQFHLLVKLPALTDSRPVLRAAAFAIDRDLPLHNLQTLQDFFDALNLNWLALVPVFTVIAAVTVLLAASGLFGLISRSVARRTHEVGIRRALGGTSWQVTMLFLRQGAVHLGIGIGGGIAGILVADVMSAAIPNILVYAAPVSGGVFLMMALVIFAASYFPTRRAVMLEPGDALRYE